MVTIDEIDAKTGLCAVIGDPIEHSLSPAIHNAAFQELGLNFVYLAFRVKKIQEAVEGIRALNIRGVSVTIPHKVAILKFLDNIDEVAQNIGSVNTVINDNGILTGYNSDSEGALKALEDAGIEPADRNVLILGSGGAARAIAFGLAMKKDVASLNILGIIKDELEKLVKDISLKTPAAVSGEMLTPHTLERMIERNNILIHSTPVGMYPKIEESLVPQNFLRKDLTVLDIVYNPLRTRLIEEAQGVGAKAVPGVEMFVNQAVVQFELWTKKKAPVSLMRLVVEKHLEGV